jgi:hypothetical protein
MTKEYTPVNQQDLINAEMRVKQAENLDEFQTLLATMADLHAKSGDPLKLKTAQLRFHHTLHKLTGTTSISKAVDTAKSPVEIYLIKALNTRYIRSRQEPTVQELKERLGQEIKSLEVQGAPTEYRRKYIRDFMIRHHMPFNKRHLHAGETLQDFRDLGYLVEEVAAVQEVITDQKLDIAGKWPEPPENSE